MAKGIENRARSPPSVFDFATSKIQKHGGTKMYYDLVESGKRIKAYYLVEVGGDIDEDEHDTKIACTELRIIRQLTKREFFLHGLAYMVDHPKRECNSHVERDRAKGTVAK